MVARSGFFTALALCASATVCGAESVPSEQWSFVVTPYLWLPSIEGTLKFNVPPGAAGKPEVGVGPNSYLENLDFMLPLAFEARKGDWSVLSDIIYLAFSGEDASVKSVSGPGGIVEVPLNTDTTTSFKGLLWTLTGGYTIARGERATLDVIGGARYLGMQASVNWQFAGPVGLMPPSGSFSQRVDLLDAIVGVRGKVKLGSSNWFIPYYLDVGTGSSSFTWQGLAGVGYSFRWGEMSLAYRYLLYDMDDDKLLQSFTFGGPALAVGFRF
jgi:hypothetical protein